MGRWQRSGPVWFNMWLTSDVEAKGARGQSHFSEEELKVVGKCAMCGEEAEGERNEHLLFKCEAEAAVEVREQVQAAAQNQVYTASGRARWHSSRSGQHRDWSSGRRRCIC